MQGLNKGNIKFQEFNTFSRKWCIDRTKEMLSSPYSFFFRDHPKFSVPNYEEYILVIKNPMWFKEVLERLNHNAYLYVHEWVYDMSSIWENAFSYNAKNTPGYDSALILQKIFNKHCVPVPSSQANLIGIRRFKILRKLAKTLLNPPSLIKKLQWEIPEINNELPVGEDLVFEIREALFKLDEETKNKLFAHPTINEIFNNPEKTIKQISAINENKESSAQDQTQDHNNA